MTKVITALRTLWLVFIVGYALYALPIALLLSSSARKVNVTVDLSVFWRVSDALWLAGFIALETVLGILHESDKSTRSEGRGTHRRAHAPESHVFLSQAHDRAGNAYDRIKG